MKKMTNENISIGLCCIHLMFWVILLKLYLRTPHALAMLQTNAMEHVLMIVWFILAKTRFRDRSNLLVILFGLGRAIMINLAMRGILPGIEMYNTDDFRNWLMVTYIIITGFAPVHYLLGLFFIMPVHLAGEYYLELAFEQIALERGLNPKPVLFIETFIRHYSYSLIIIYGLYRQQRRICELIVKHRIVHQEQDDVQRILAGSSSGILVYDQIKLPDLEE